jgi:hypothetical protein
MKKLVLLIFTTGFFALNSCDVANDLMKVASQNLPLTEQEVVNGLKSALEISTDTAVNIVSATNGFFKDNAIKILLPPEADIITQNMNNPLLKAIGVSGMIDDVILRMNRSAEQAAKQATPIFVNSIKTMSIQDAFGILNGSDTSATHYFRVKTYGQLQNAFKPKIRNSLNKPIVSGISANKAWSTLTSGYNEVANFVPGWKKVNTNLDDYVTRKALDGLFLKVALEERQIRNNPSARVNDILKRVFGEKLY